MLAEALNHLTKAVNWDLVVTFLNSNFTAALAGALAGALVAQRIGDRSKQRGELLQEIRSTNAAITLAFNICNFGISTKRQFVKNIYETYTSQKSALKEFQERRATGKQPPDMPFEFQADLRTLESPVVPVDVLKQQVYENVSSIGRPIALVSAIVGTIASLDGAIKRRNAHIELFKKLGAQGVEQVPPLYFGLPYGPGHVSTEFSDSVEALSSLTDDLIFFCDLLIKDLMAHGDKVLQQYKKVSRLKEERILSVDLTEARELGLMPAAEDYANWLKGFASPSDKKSASIFRRMFARFNEKK